MAVRFPASARRRSRSLAPSAVSNPAFARKSFAPSAASDPASATANAAEVELADGKERQIQHMVATSFWHPDGTPMSAQQFMTMLFGQLPDFFKNEAELRRIWSDPETRGRLLHGLSEKGFGHEQLAEMQRLIDAEKSDLFDVLAYVAYAMPPHTREVRAANARVYINSSFDTKQKLFLDFVLQHYVNVGIDEFGLDKLTPCRGLNTATP